MRRITVISGLLLLFLLPQARAQGIMGHRFIAGFRYDYFFSYLHSEGFLDPGYKVSLSYVTSKRTELILGFNYFRIRLEEPVHENGYGGDVLGDATDKSSCRELDLSLRWYLQKFGSRNYDCIAPDGKYFEFGVVGSKTLYSPGDLPYYVDVTPEFTSARVVVGIGNQQVWWDRLAVNTGILGSLTVYQSVKDESGNTVPYSDWNRVRNLFRCYIGIGYVF